MPSSLVPQGIEKNFKFFCVRGNVILFAKLAQCERKRHKAKEKYMWENLAKSTFSKKNGCLNEQRLKNLQRNLCKFV
jgi:hypothetical protein